MTSRIEFPSVAVDSKLMALAFRLERLRGELATGTTPPAVFFELHALFQFLSSVISARIEGNHTTLADAVSGAVAAHVHPVDDQMNEILNVARGMDWIDEQPTSRQISHAFIRQLHELAVDGLAREGDLTPGRYRSHDVAISGAAHVPPNGFSVQPDMDDLIEFINRDVPPQFQLIHVAITHHRFVWIHPFGNGNGRVSRLLSYAMLARHGFVSPIGMRAVNPTAVFGVARERYYQMLSEADHLTNSGSIAWCEFFLEGLLRDLERAHQLQDLDFVSTRLIAPSLDSFVASGRLSSRERAVLWYVFTHDEAKAGDMAELVPGSPSVRSQFLRPLIERRLLIPQSERGRIYHLSFASNEFTPFIVRQLDALGFLPPLLKEAP